jgi:actin-related protein 10
MGWWVSRRVGLVTLTPPKHCTDIYRSSALKVGGSEVVRERWDEADASQFDHDDSMLVDDTRPLGSSILPDWTRTPLPTGAPSAKAISQAPLVQITSPTSAAVGA